MREAGRPVIWQRRKSGHPPAGMLERWQQVYRSGEVALHPFTQAEVDAVTLDAEALPAAERGPFLQAVTPLLTAPGTTADTVEDIGGTGTGPQDGGAAASAEAVARLERLGFLRPGPPAPAAGPAPAELAGWAVGPGGDVAARRPVTLIGDLAVVTRIRAQPVWVAEVSVSPEPSRPEPVTSGWRVAARMYAPHRPPVGLVELPAGGKGKVPPFVLVRDDRAVYALVSWCGADVAAAVRGPATDGGTGRDPDAGKPAAVPTAELSGTFAKLAQLRVALAQGQGVLLRNLVVATGEGKHWLLEGEWWQRAVPVSVDDLGRRASGLLKLPGDRDTLHGG